MISDEEIRASFIRTGKMRAAINLGNPILANKDASSEEPVGVSVDLAREFCQRLDAELELLVVDTALKSVDAVAAGSADLGFFAVDPNRAQSIGFTAPYVLIEGFYLVRDDSPIRCNEDVDRQGVRVVVGKGSAYDLFLSRELKHASLVGATTSQTVVAKFLDENLEVAAGVKQQLESDARKTPGLRLLPERFMVIQQAMGIALSRGPAAIAYLRRFTEDMKRSGFVANAMRRHGIVGASVAPATDENQSVG